MSAQMISLISGPVRLDMMVGINKVIIKYTLKEETILFNLLDQTKADEILAYINRLDEYGLIGHYGKNRDLIFLCGETKITIESDKLLGLIVNHANRGFVAMTIDNQYGRPEGVWSVAYSDKSYFDLPDVGYEDSITRCSPRVLPYEGTMQNFIHKRLHYDGTIH